tara:strand:+ start:144 stop:317 length:174 start_codon:yes stop_codon:yes gene_type:complete
MKLEHYIITEDLEVQLIFRKNKDDVLELNEKETLEVFEKKIKELKRSLELLKNNVVR